MGPDSTIPRAADASPATDSITTEEAKQPGWVPVSEPAAYTGLAARGDDPEHAARMRRFRRGVYVTVLVLVAAVMALNAWVDPFGDLRQQRETSRQDVTVKLDLIEGWKTPPELVVLGPSPVMKYDPRDVERILDATAFNGGVTGAQPSVAYAFASYIADLHPDDMPNLVLGVNDFAFYEGQDNYLRGDRRLSRHLIEESFGERAKRIGALASLPLARSSLEVLGKETSKGTGLDELDDVQLDYRKVDELGFLLRDYPSDPRVVAQTTANHSARYRRALERWREQGGDLDADQTEYVRRTIKLANDHGNEPFVLFTPVNPVTSKLLEGTGFDAQQRRVLDFYESLQEDGLDFTIVDARDLGTWRGSQADFYDATHISPEAASRIIELIATQR
ncbi:MAG: hypothetical protein JWO69_360 [Thermoleophilia bacterium]|nr:hypothetical protein [Thermoleophilia bacterium]